MLLTSVFFMAGSDPKRNETVEIILRKPWFYDPFYYSRFAK